MLRVDEILVEMRALARLGDPEISHGEADDLLLEALELLGEPEIAEAFRHVPKWYA